MKWLPALAGALALSCLSTPMQAGAQTYQQKALHRQYVRYFHASGAIKAIGKAAYRTQYHPNPLIRLAWVQKLHKLMQIREDAAAKIRALRARIASSGYPPHHALWLCIARYEGSWSDTSSPYTGGLQMHLNWYGLANAGTVSQAAQEWVAEKAWKANGYSYSFLYGQWFKWDNADGCVRYT